MDEVTTPNAENLIDQILMWDDIGEGGIRDPGDSDPNTTTILIGALGEAERFMTVITDDVSLRDQINNPSSGWKFAVSITDQSLNETWPNSEYRRPHLVAEITIPNATLGRVADLIEADSNRSQGFF